MTHSPDSFSELEALAARKSLAPESFGDLEALAAQVSGAPDSFAELEAAAAATPAPAPEPAARPSAWARFRHRLKGHPGLEDFVEEGAYIEDMIAAIGGTEMSAWCPTCQVRVYWRESNV